MSFRSYPMQGLMPAIGGTLAPKQAVNLPYGGQVDAGSAFPQGVALGNVGGTAQPEIWTITSTGDSGTFTFLFATPLGVYPSTVAYNVSTSDLKAALEADIFGTGSIASVSGSAGTSYVITFANNVRMGGLISFTNTFGSGSISLVRTQQGSSGTGQYDVYDGSDLTKVKAFLEYLYANGPQGDRGTEFGSTGQPFSPSAYVGGYFNVADVTGVDSAAMTQGNLIFEVGTALTDEGAVIQLL